jgi:hypothetical protein
MASLELYSDQTGDTPKPKIMITCGYYSGWLTLAQFKELEEKVKRVRGMIDNASLFKSL